MILSFFTDMFAFLTQMMTTHAATFEAIGSQMYVAFTAIVVVWFGIEWALSGRGLPETMPYMVRMMLMISFGFAMTRYYSIPIPIFGVSFYHLIVDQGTQLANDLNGRMATTIMQRLDQLYMDIETPGISAMFNLVEALRWATTILLIAAAQAAMFGIIAFGYIATAVCVLLGPVFIPFFIMPKLEWLFWGWLRALLQYAFYPVVGNAYIFVFGSLLINFVDRAGTNWSSAQIAVMFLPLLLLLISFTYGLLKIPSLVNSLFTGKAGESALPW